MQFFGTPILAALGSFALLLGVIKVLSCMIDNVYNLDVNRKNNFYFITDG